MIIVELIVAAWLGCVVAVVLLSAFAFRRPAENLLDYDFTVEHLDDREWPECKVIELRPRVRVEVYDDAA